MTLFSSGRRETGSWIYDYGSEKRIVGAYVGTIDEGVFRYSWRWLDHDLQGNGQMRLNETGTLIEGEWWYDNNRKELEPFRYCRVSNVMPPWVKAEDFHEYEGYLDGKASTGFT